MADYPAVAAVRIYRFLPNESEIKVITYDAESQGLVQSSSYVADPTRHQYEGKWVLASKESR